MKPLSIWNYYWNNKRKILPIIAILIFSVLAIMAPPAILDTVKQDILQGFHFYEQYAVLFYNGAEADELTKTELEEKLQAFDSVDHVIETQQRVTQRYALSGDIDTPVFFLKSDDYDTFLEHLNLELREGALPEENSDQIVLTAKIAKNKALSVGDVFGKAVDENDTIPGEFILSGTIDSDSLSFGVGNYEYVNQTQSVTSWYLVAPKTGKYQEMLDDLDELKETHSFLSIETEPSLHNRMEVSFGSLDLVFLVVSLILVVVISISVALLKIIFFMQRANEFGLLAAIGYSKKFILRRTMLEVFVIILVGWGLGIVVTWGLFRWLNHTLYEPKAFIPLNLLQPDVLMYSLPIPIAVSLFSVVTVMWQLLTMDPVSIIERRD